MPLANIKVMLTSNGQEFQANSSPNLKCWRLVHDGKKVITFMESEGVTTTKHSLFCSLLFEECNFEIARLGLDRTEFDARQKAMAPPEPAFRPKR